MKKFFRLTNLIKIISLVSVIGLLIFLFWNDILVFLDNTIYSLNKDSSESIVFDGVEIKPGFVEYTSDEQTEIEIVFPKLSTVRAELEIPNANIKGKIVDGVDDEAMDRGFWHYPTTASPFNSSGNTVIIGHRYLKLPPHKDTFYNLNKVEVGDRIILRSTFDTVEYIARNIMIINSDEQSILQQTENEQITLVTCHPLWTSKQRLIVVGDKITD